MKNSVLILSLSLLTLFSCKEEEIKIVCFESNPIENLSWLREEIQLRKDNDHESSKYSYISQAEYRGSTIFIFRGCCVLCNSWSPAYDCEGNYVGRLGCDGGDHIKPKDLDNDFIVWAPDDLVCIEGTYKIVC